MEEETGQRVLGKGAQPSAGNCALAEQKGCRTGLRYVRDKQGDILQMAEAICQGGYGFAEREFPPP